MRILIDDKEVEERAYPLPWYSDATCFNFKCPGRQLSPDILGDIKRPSYVETLVIACDLEDYSFIGRMKNLTQLYIYSGNNINDLAFLETLVKLRHLCILDSHITSLDSLKSLIVKKYKLYKSVPASEELKWRLTYGFEGVCIMTDAYDSDATELVKECICTDEIRVNNNLISYGYSIRKHREEMMLQRRKKKTAGNNHRNGGKT